MTSARLNVSTSSGSLRIDLFCRVIDNFGDAGVCWRLARQLNAEFGHQIRFVVDDLSAFSLIEPRIQPAVDRQSVADIDVFRWASFSAACEADVVIEAFACDPPRLYVESMVACPVKPVWINLEYLSAEAWVDGVHALPSPHPRLPLTKHFFCPGFTEKTGGLIREHSVRASAGITDEGAAVRSMFVFTYPHAPVRALVAAFAHRQADKKFQIALAAPLNDQCAEWTSLAPVPQMEFDALLRGYDFLLVRGEDSFVRAQYAGKPMLWHIYPTEDQAHITKLDAWLDHYCADMPLEIAVVYRRASHAFVVRGDEGATEAFHDLTTHFDPLRAHAVVWARKLFNRSHLVDRLLGFIKEKRAGTSRL